MEENSRRTSLPIVNRNAISSPNCTTAWDDDNEKLSYDSDRSEEDSMCSWSSGHESYQNNWRQWKKNSNSNSNSNSNPHVSGTAVLSLTELTCRFIAIHLPFELVEMVYPPVPEQLQLRIAFWSFPEHEDDIFLYSCLANGSPVEYINAEDVFYLNIIQDIIQIGFYLTATVKPKSCLHISSKMIFYNVAITFDRGMISSCNCTCQSKASWCSHVISVCLYRIRKANDVILRAPISESLSRLDRNQLQKFAQYLISELPQQILPTAQQILDELLRPQLSAINIVCGAPDPTAGSSINDQTVWCLDSISLRYNIHRTLVKFCIPSPIVYSDVNYLSAAAPPVATEWSLLLRPLRGREPEGMWNLTSIVREMFSRSDRNAIPLLEIMTEEILSYDQMIFWWFSTKMSFHNMNSISSTNINISSNSNSNSNNNNKIQNNNHSSQYACSLLCDEIVVLWRLAVLNPALSPKEKDILHSQFHQWQILIAAKIAKYRFATNTNVFSINTDKTINKSANSVIFDGFKSAINACFLDWNNYVIPGVTYSNKFNPIFNVPFKSLSGAQLNKKGTSTTEAEKKSISTKHLNTSEHSLTETRSTAFSTIVFNNASRIIHNSKLTDNLIGNSKKKKYLINTNSRLKYNNEILFHSENNDINLNSLRLKLIEEFDFSSEESSCGSNEDELVSLDSNEFLCKLQHKHKQLENSSSQNTDLENDESGETDLLVNQNKNIAQPEEIANVMDPSIDNIHNDQHNKHIDYDKTKKQDDNKIVNFGTLSDPVVQSTDEYSFYFYDTVTANEEFKRKSSLSNNNTTSETLNQLIISSVPQSCNETDVFEILYARAEGLYAHGHKKEACKLVSELAIELMENPPELIVDLPKNSKREPISLCFASGSGTSSSLEPENEVKLQSSSGSISTETQVRTTTPTSSTLIQDKVKRKRNFNQIHSEHHRVTCLASETLKKCYFFATVLMESKQNRSLAFRIALFGLELNRLPASTKLLEVKLANQETELVTLIKNTHLSVDEVSVLLNKAIDLQNGLICRQTLLLFNLAHLIFDVLVVIPKTTDKYTINDTFIINNTENEKIAFGAVIYALNLKTNVSEAEHPLLCESIRRQRGELSMAMLLHYKNDQWKLLEVMDKLLDKDVHQLSRFPLIAAYYSNNPPTCSQSDRLKKYHIKNSTIQTNNDNDTMFTATNNNTNNNNLLEKKVKWNRIDDVALSLKQIPIPLPIPIPIPIPIAIPINKPKLVRCNKESRFKKIYPTVPNQPSEASAHFMFELAKNLLFKAGGNSTITLFTTSAGQGIANMSANRGLLMCSLQLGLYALGLHNCVSPNWFNRTYSSYVTWITGQSLEIGPAAIAFIIDCWERHLTPSETLSLADRASRACDTLLIKSSSQLALSCLKHAYALNQQEIYNALLLCKDQGNDILEEGCLIVENVARNSNVNADVLFKVSEYWFDMYTQSDSSKSNDSNQSSQSDSELQEFITNEFHSHFNQHNSKTLPLSILNTHNQKSSQYFSGVSVGGNGVGVGVGGAGAGANSNTSSNCSLINQFQLTGGGVGNIFSFENSNNVQYPFAVQNTPSIFPPTHTNCGQNFPSLLATNRTSSIFNNIKNYPTNTNGLISNEISSFSHAYQYIPLQAKHHNHFHHHSYRHNHNHSHRNNHNCYHSSQYSQFDTIKQPSPITTTAPTRIQTLRQLTPRQTKYLLSVYRVGLLALESLARKIHEDSRLLSKFSRNPQYALAVIWHLRISKYLGDQYLQQFTQTALSTISNPFILYDIAIESAYYYSGMNSVLFSQHIQTTLLPLVQKCQQMFLQCLNNKIYHLGVDDFDEFFSAFEAAKNAFSLTSNGMNQLDDWIQALRRFFFYIISRTDKITLR